MGEINWGLIAQPVDIGAQITQGFLTGRAIRQKMQADSALANYAKNPNDPQAFSALSLYQPEVAQNVLQTRALEQKQAEAARVRALTAQIGQIGATDPRAAQTAALQGGDTDLAAAWGKLADDQKKAAAERWGAAASVAFKMKGMANPEERLAYWKEARPILETQGADHATLDRVDPTNIGQLDAIITTAQKVDDLYTQSQPKQFTVPEGGAVVQRNADGSTAVLYAPNDGSHAFGDPVTGGDNGLSGGGAGGKNYGTGLRVPGSKKFQQFGSQEEATAAQHAQLNRYLGRGINTVGGIVETYAPRESKGGDNTDEQVNNYIQYVSQRAGIDPTKPISAAQVPAVAAAMREFESGHKQRIAGVHDAAAIRDAAHKAIAAGADPQKVRERAASQGGTL